ETTFFPRSLLSVSPASRSLIVATFCFRSRFHSSAFIARSRCPSMISMFFRYVIIGMILQFLLHDVHGVLTCQLPDLIAEIGKCLFPHPGFLRRIGIKPFSVPHALPTRF